MQQTAKKFQQKFDSRSVLENVANSVTAKMAAIVATLMVYAANI